LAGRVESTGSRWVRIETGVRWIVENAEPRAPRRRAVAWHVLKLAVGVAVVAVLMRMYDFRKVAGVIGDIDLGWLVQAWGFGLLAMVSFVLVQAIVFRPLGPSVTWPFLLKVQFQQRFYGMFLPGGSELVVKWYKLSRPTGRPGMTVALMVFVRVFSGASIALVTAVAVYLDPRFPWPAARGAAAGVALLTIAVPVVLMAPPLRRGLVRLALSVPVPRRFAGLAEKLGAIPEAIGGLTPRDVAAMLALSLFSQVCFILQQAYCAYAVGIELPMATFGWLRTLVAVCSNFPFTISGLGLREANMAAFLSFYDIPKELAVGYSLVFFAAFPVVKGLIGGLMELADMLQSFRGVRKPSAE